MRYTLVGELPHHLYVWVDTSFTHKEPAGFIPAVWFGLVAYPGRTWGCTVMLESGAVYRNLPPHALAFDLSPDPWLAGHAQRWDCYGWDFTVIEYSYLRGLDCKVRVDSSAELTVDKLEGQYLFTAAPVGDAFSAQPEQAKEFHFIRLDNGRLTIQPTDFIVFRERSFTDNKLEFPVGLKRQVEIYYCE